MSYNCVYGFIDVTTVLSLCALTEIFINLTGGTSSSRPGDTYVCSGVAVSQYGNV